ncbi:MAG: iron donor protein CyaY [Gammaproteobacteria bacterium]|nr:iron donor protein CyaY [Gammaproteobacteria bacterium]
MSQAQYNAAIEQSLAAIEDALDHCPWDIDYERNDAVLTLTLESNGSQVILSRQSATEQLWLAAKSGGYHCTLENTGKLPAWKCTTTGESLSALLNRVLSEQQDEPISLNIEGND